MAAARLRAPVKVYLARAGLDGGTQHVLAFLEVDDAVAALRATAASTGDGLAPDGRAG